MCFYALFARVFFSLFRRRKRGGEAKEEKNEDGDDVWPHVTGAGVNARHPDVLTQLRTLTGVH